MAKYETQLDRSFHALADPTRRAVVQHLRQGPATVSQLAQPFAIGLPSFLKHLRALEAAGLITTEKRGRERLCHLQTAALTALETWLADQRAEWQAKTDRLAIYVETQIKPD